MLFSLPKLIYLPPLKYLNKICSYIKNIPYDLTITFKKIYEINM